MDKEYEDYCYDDYENNDEYEEFKESSDDEDELIIRGVLDSQPFNSISVNEIYTEKIEMLENFGNK